MTGIEFGLNTAQSGKAEFTTSKISGKLKAIIIDSPESVKLKVSFGSFVLLDLPQFAGNEYFAVRRYAVNEKNERINYSSTEWIISDKIVVVVEGRNNADVKFKLIME